jgi:hypothetical protein
MFPGVLSAQEETAFHYDSQGRRDPFWPLVSSGGAIINYGSDLLITDMILEGIINDTNNRNYAIINGVIVGANDKIGLFTVRRVDKDKVFLEKDQENFVLKLKRD